MHIDTIAIDATIDAESEAAKLAKHLNILYQAEWLGHGLSGDGRVYHGFLISGKPRYFYLDGSELPYYE